MSARKGPEAFRTIGEVADWLGVNTHVLRFWETKFSQIRPVKRAGGRRYYRPSDMALLGGIKVLLHEDGLTIKGAQKVLREKGVKAVCALSPAIDDEATPFPDDPGAAQEAGTPQETGAAQEAGAAPPDPAPETGPAIPAAADPEPQESEADHRIAASGISSPDVPLRDGPLPEAEPAAAGTLPEEDEEDPLPPRAPLPGVPEGQLGLFGDLPPFGAAPDVPADNLPAEPSPTREAEADGARAEAEAPAEATEAAAESLAEASAEASDGPGSRSAPRPPRIAPLPGEDLPLPDALARLVPGQLPAETLAPILARAEALRMRMDVRRP